MTPEDICTAFALFHLPPHTDTDILTYCSNILLTAHQDNEDIDSLIDSLEDFFPPPTIHSHTFKEALTQQLFTTLSSSSSSSSSLPNYTWLLQKQQEEENKEHTPPPPPPTTTSTDDTLIINEPNIISNNNNKLDPINIPVFIPRQHHQHVLEEEDTLSHAFQHTHINNIEEREGEFTYDANDASYYYYGNGNDNEEHGYYHHHQQQQQQQWNVDSDDPDAFIAVLAQSFPQYSSKALHDIFTQQGCDPGATIQVLTALEAELSGQYVGYNNNGTTSQSSQQKEQQQQHPSFDVDSEFPTLGGDTKKSSNNNNNTQMWGQPSFADRAKAPPPPTININMNGAAPRASSRHTPTTSTNSTKAAPPRHIWEATGIQQFQTGSSVAADYTNLRSEARDHARLRNACYEQATQAYLAGNKALAKELGAKGRWHAQHMQTAHDAAASELFNQRNKGLSSSSSSYSGSGGDGILTIDLHGLHVAEALDKLDELLSGGGGGGIRKGQQLRIVVGVGTHGKVPSRLPAAVKRHLTEVRRVRYREPYQGLIELNV